MIFINLLVIITKIVFLLLIFIFILFFEVQLF